jgi:RNA polymerase sigma-70 factor (ECF subfamily)
VVETTVQALPPLAHLFRFELIHLQSVLPTGENQIDLELARRMDRGDEQALLEVYSRYSRPVFGLLLRYLADRDTAEDVQQQIFTEVWQKAGAFDPGRGSMLGWIMSIARSRAIDQTRKRVPEPKDPEATAVLVDRGGSYEEIDRLIGAFQFSHLLGQLPEDEAELIRYRFQNELSQSEIAARTGIPLGTIKSRMVSALGRLRTLLEAEA